MLTLQIKEKEIENLTPDEEFIRGTVGAKCQINFDDFWQYYEKYVVFKRVGYEPINIMVDSLENEIEIPYTILVESGEFKIGVFGITETETLPTLYSKDIKIRYGTDTHGTTPPKYEPNEIDQLRLLKQDSLVSGTNIKTINNQSILGSGNITIEGGSGSSITIDQTFDPDSENAQSGKAVAEAVEPKLDKPSMPPTVGNVLKVLSLNEDGTFTCEWSDAPSGGTVDDVQINGASIVENGVANIPIGSVNTFGVFKVGSGIGVNSGGSLFTTPATNAQIINRSSSYAHINPGSLDYAVKAAMCDGKGAAWTAEEQAAARSRMGVGEYDLVVDVTITEETQNINIETDSYGNPLNLKNAMVIIYTVGTSSNSGEGGMLIRLFQNSNSKGLSIHRTRAFRSNPDATIVQYVLTVEDFAIAADTSSNTNPTFNTSAAIKNNNPFKALKGIYLSGNTPGSNTFGIGSRIVIYGVRA